jgi:dienelactone hydrolase
MLRRLLILFGLAVTQFVYAATQLPEEVVFISKKLLIGSINLETTIFKPDGEGPFPLVIINHGKSFGNSHMQERYRPISPVRYFLERNYAVFVPMRQGFSKSGGNYSDGSCSMAANGANQAEDIQPVINYAQTLSFVDKTKTLIVGQSHGGWTTLAYGANDPDKSVKGLVNFAGGLKNDSCGGWQSDLYRTAATFGRKTAIPTIWFYGDNDSYFSRDVSDAMFENYKKGNPKSQFVAYGLFGSDSHGLFTNRDGRVIWEPYLTKFLVSIDMPSKVINEKYAPTPQTPNPAKSDFAPIGDIDKVPNVKENGKEAYRLFLTKPFPRAFVISEKGNYAWEYGGEDPIDRALARCESRANMKCKAYAVDDYVTWQQ